MEAVRRADPRADRRRRPGHRVRAPGPGDLRRQRVRGPARRHDRHLRVHQRVHAPVRQPVPVDEPQADRRLALRQLPRGVGGEPADRPGQDPSDAVQRLPAGRRPARRRTTCTATRTRARSACCAWHREEGLGVTDEELRGEAPRGRSTVSAGCRAPRVGAREVAWAHGSGCGSRSRTAGTRLRRREARIQPHAGRRAPRTGAEPGASAHRGPQQHRGAGGRSGPRSWRPPARDRQVARSGRAVGAAADHAGRAERTAAADAEAGPGRGGRDQGARGGGGRAHPRQGRGRGHRAARAVRDAARRAGRAPHRDGGRAHRHAGGGPRGGREDRAQGR